jgi:polyisoprenoid-binding protein YceI
MPDHFSELNMRAAMVLLCGVFFSFVGLAGAVGAELAPVPVSGGTATLSPQNTSIRFVGVHTGDKPDPRTGGFAKFSGKVTVDPATSAIKSISTDIDTTSLYTSIPKLTDHLRTADFFEVREYPSAKFVSTKVAAGKAGAVQVTGNLTLHGVTKEISFPATVEVTDKGLTLTSEFTIDRSQFGMNYGLDKVDKNVAMTVVVGQKTEVK